MSDIAATPLTLGFMPLLDCATLVVAERRGFAAAEGLGLRLVRETSWANIRDRLIVGHFSAAQMLGPMVVAASLGVGQLHVEMVAPIALGLGGNAITVSSTLWSQMASQGATSGAPPGQQAAALARVVNHRAGSGQTPLTFAMVFPFSSHNYLLRHWLASAGIDPDRDVRLVVLPPPLLVDALRSGQVDGFCVGEPWNSLAVEAGLGSIAAVTSDLWRFGPEKVLGMRRDWADRHPETVAQLVRAIDASSRWCDDPANRSELASLLAEPRHVGATAGVLHAALAGRLPFAHGGEAMSRPDFITFARHGAAMPWPHHAAWFHEQMVRWGQLSAASGSLEIATSSYRADLYRGALGTTLHGAGLPAEPPAGSCQLFDA